MIVFRAPENVVLAADLDTGALRWSRRFPPDTRITVDGGYLLASGPAGAELVELAGGQTRWRRCVGSFRERGVVPGAERTASDDLERAATSGALCR